MEPTTEPTIKTPTTFLSCTDALLFLSKIESDSVDLVITDPPYESLEKHRKTGTTTRLKHSKSSSNDWFDIIPNEYFDRLLPELYRVMKPNTHFYLFSDQETMFVVKPKAEAAGFKFWKPIVWDKKKIGMGYHYRARYEFILFFEKGKRKLNNLGIPDILEAPRVERGYPTEKPVSIMETLILQSSVPGDVVIDPFFGSCPVGIAAFKHGRNFLGADSNEGAINLALARLRETC